MGIAGIIAYQESASNEDNVRNMNEAAQRVRTCTDTYAVRNSVVGDLKIKKNDIIGPEQRQGGNQRHGCAGPSPWN